MRYAYADSPYLGQCKLYNHHHEEPWGCWDDPATHYNLVGHLMVTYPDGWAMSLSSPSLRTVLPMCPDDVRVGAWTKTFASFKPGVNPAYCWEPVIFRGGRRRTDKKELTVRDYLAAPITLQKGLTGAKPIIFCRWVLDLLGYQDGDEMVDLFPGSGVMGRVLAQGRLAI